MLGWVRQGRDVEKHFFSVPCRRVIEKLCSQQAGRAHSEYSTVQTATGTQTSEDRMAKNVNILSFTLAVALYEDIWICGGNKKIKK